MPRVGIRELKNDASAIIRAVREERTEYIVTYHGQAVAMIVPIDEALVGQETERRLAEARAHADYWARLDELAAEIAAAWQSDKSAVELIDEQRRDLSTP